MAAVRPPRGLPTKREFFLFSTTRFISRSLTLLSMGTAPSVQNTFSSVHWPSLDYSRKRAKALEMRLNAAISFKAIGASFDTLSLSQGAPKWPKTHIQTVFHTNAPQNSVESKCSAV